MVIVGGLDDLGMMHNDAWALSLPAPPAAPAWALLLPDGAPGAPAGRRGAGAVYDAVGDRLVLFGGQDDSAVTTYVSDVHVLSLGASPAWSSPSVTNAAATLGTDGHLFPVAVYDSLRRRMLVYGGEGTFLGPRADAAFLDLATLAWTPLSPASPPLGRSQAAAVYDPVRDRLAVFGGLDSNGAANAQTHFLAAVPVPTWSSPLLAPVPPACQGMSAVFDAPNRRMVFWSGDDTDSSGPFHRELWALDLDAPAWSMLLDTCPMPGRLWTSAVYDALHARLLIFGGAESNFALPVDTVEWIGL
jgi:hypothetical protein